MFNRYLKKFGFWVFLCNFCFFYREVFIILSSFGICVIDFIVFFVIKLWILVVGCILLKNKKLLGLFKLEVKKLFVIFVKVKLLGLVIILLNKVLILRLIILIFGFCFNIWEVVVRVLLWFLVNKVNFCCCLGGRVCLIGIIFRFGRFGKIKFLVLVLVRLFIVFNKLFIVDWVFKFLVFK